MNGAITANVASVFATRSVESEQVTQSILGTPVKILERVEGWSLIHMPDDYKGWIRDCDWTETNYPGTPEVAETTDLIANLRAAKTSKAAPIALAPIGAVLEFLGESDGWLELKHPDGRTCWLEKHRARIRPADEIPAPPTREGLVATAKRLLGTPYVWGANSPFGIDCSGFAQLVYRLNGLLLLRDAHEQAEQGEPVDKADLLPGDLIFFGPVKADGSRSITHVAMSLGGSEFMHASGSSYVKINSLDEPRYAEIYMLARRYVK